MEKVKILKKVIFEIMTEYADFFKISGSDLRYEFIFDEKNNHFQLVRLGWHDRKRVHLIIFHIDIINNKIWIQQDNTEKGVANLLTEKGIDKSEIVLAYFSPSHRKMTGFAVA